MALGKMVIHFGNKSAKVEDGKFYVSETGIGKMG
jgi:hypothetical protein